jgi:hypothetical protein
MRSSLRRSAAQSSIANGGVGTICCAWCVVVSGMELVWFGLKFGPVCELCCLRAYSTQTVWSRWTHSHKQKSEMSVHSVLCRELVSDSCSMYTIMNL